MFKFKRPTLITITGPSASGKSYIHNRLINADPDGGPAPCHKIRSVTSRLKRDGEIDGEDYIFLNESEIVQMSKNGDLVEHNVYLGNHYGVTYAELVHKLRTWNLTTPVIILDPNGIKTFEQICRKYNVDMLKLFVFSPSLVINERLNSRFKTDLSKALTIDEENTVKSEHEQRLKNASKEQYWLHSNIWDAILDGTNYENALESLKQAVIWKNRRNEEPAPFNGF